MPAYRLPAASAAALLLLSAGMARAQDSPGALAFVTTNPTPLQATDKDLSATRTNEEPATSDKAQRRSGGVEKQIPSVSTACLRPELMRIVHGASAHFGSTAVITSGYRRSRSSYHGKCMAADVQVAGVSPGTLARYFRGQSGVGGVGTYGHTRSVHVDVAPRSYTWHHGRKKARYAALGTSGCPCCAGRSPGASRGASSTPGACSRVAGSGREIVLGARRA